MKSLDIEDSSLFQLLWEELMRILCRKPKRNRTKHIRRYIIVR